MTDRSDIDDVGVGGVGEYAGYLMSILQADVLECFAAVGGLVDAISPGYAVPVVGLTGADPDDVGIGLK